MLGRSLDLTYDGQGNRKSLQVDGELSHSYTPGLANEYTSVSYGSNVAAVAGVAVTPGRVVVGDALAQRQAGYFFRGYAAQAGAAWDLVDVFAAAQQPPGQMVTEVAHGQKLLYRPPASVTPVYDDAGNLLQDGQWIYVYDGNSRLRIQTSVAPHPEGRWRELAYQYDYLGRRIHKLVQAIDSGGTPAPLRHYAWGLGKEGVRPGAGGQELPGPQRLHRQRVRPRRPRRRLRGRLLRV